MAPEVIADKGYDGKKADVWSCGVILYVLLAGFLPFDEGTIMALFTKIQAADFTYPKWFSPEVRELLDKILVADPKVRISLSQVKEDPWMEKYRPDTENTPDTSSPHPTMSSMKSTDGDGEFAVDGSLNDLGDDEEDDHWGALIGRTARGPRYLNAFDLVSQCGGFHLDRIFNPQVLNTKMSTSLRSKSMMSRSKSSRFGVASKQRDSVNFTSEVVPAENLMKGVCDALESMGFKFENSLETAMSSGRVRANIVTAKGMVGISCQVFTLCSTLSLLEIRRGKGDVLEWNHVYTELIDRKIVHLINQVAADGSTHHS